MNKSIKIILLTFFLVFLSHTVTAAKYTLESVTVINLNPSRNQIMVKLPNNVMEQVGVGHFISNTRVKLSKVFSDRALVEATVVVNGEPTTRKYWLYKAKKGRSKIERA